MRSLVFVAVLGMASLVGIVHAPVASASAADTASDEAAFVAKINQLRSSLGLGTLAVDGQLTQIARDWSQNMANAGDISHNPNLGTLVTSNWRKLGENVGMGPELGGLFQAFVNSPHHYANLIDPSFNYVGVGVVWKNGTMFTSHEFMQLKSGSSSPPPTAPRVTTATTRRPTVAAPRPQPIVTVTTLPPAPTTTTTAPPPPPPPAVPERVRLSQDLLRLLDPTH